MVYTTSKITQRKKDERKRQIIQSARKIFSEKGYDKTTIKEIVEDAGTSIGNFYFYFKNKEALFEFLYDEMAEMLKRVSDFALKRNGLNVVNGFCRSKTAELWAFQHCEGLARALLIEATGKNQQFEDKCNEIFRHSNERIEEIFTKLCHKQLLAISDIKIGTLLCNGSMYHVIMDWLQNKGDSALTDYAYQIITFNLNGFKIDYKHSDVELYINRMLEELETDFVMFES